MTPQRQEEFGMMIGGEELSQALLPNDPLAAAPQQGGGASYNIFGGSENRPHHHRHPHCHHRRRCIRPETLLEIWIWMATLSNVGIVIGSLVSYFDYVSSQDHNDDYPDDDFHRRQHHHHHHETPTSILLLLLAIFTSLNGLALVVAYNLQYKTCIKVHSILTVVTIIVLLSIGWSEAEFGDLDGVMYLVIAFAIASVVVFALYLGFVTTSTTCGGGGGGGGDPSPQPPLLQSGANNIFQG